jgi:thymidylate synthase
MDNSCNNLYIGDDFNKIYLEVLEDLYRFPEFTSTNRKGEKLHELMNTQIVLKNIDNCYSICRNMSMTYLIGELLFYIKGENKLKNIIDYSKFWAKCSDDGENVNSCYGYYIWKRLTTTGNTQFEYCAQQLLKNPESKKAVITIYNGVKHSKETNDNPCTMNLQFYIRKNKLYLTVNMRSNDIWYGLPYDLPFFVFLQKAMIGRLSHIISGLTPGAYIHNAVSLHLYERNFKDAYETIHNEYKGLFIPNYDCEEALLMYNDIDINNKITLKGEFMNFANKILDNKKYIDLAKKEAKLNSTCLKKKVGCVIVKDGNVLTKGHGGRSLRQGPCKECVAKKEKFYHDSCNSIHSEMNAILSWLKAGYDGRTLFDSIVYLTHGPCDQCMKLLIDMSIKKVVYDVPYKTDFEKYKGLIEVEDINGKKII